MISKQFRLNKARLDHQSPQTCSQTSKLKPIRLDCFYKLWQTKVSWEDLQICQIEDPTERRTNGRTSVLCRACKRNLGDPIGLVRLFWGGSAQCREDLKALFWGVENLNGFASAADPAIFWKFPGRFKFNLMFQAILRVLVICAGLFQLEWYSNQSKIWSGGRFMNSWGVGSVFCL